MPVSLIQLNRGPPRKPSAIKKLEGTYRADKAAGNPREPKGIAIKIPAPPDYLRAIEKEIWSRIAPIVDGLRIATTADLDCYELLVTALALVRDARDLLAKEGLTYTTKAGAVVQHPSVHIIGAQTKIAMLAMMRFGLTPADRSRVSELESDVAGAKDSLDEFAEGE